MIAKKKKRKTAFILNWLEQKLQTKVVILKYFSLNSAVLAHIRTLLKDKDLRKFTKIYEGLRITGLNDIISSILTIFKSITLIEYIVIYFSVKSELLLLVPSTQFPDAGIWTDIYIHASIAFLFAFLHHFCFTMTKTKSKLLLGDSLRQAPVGPFLEKKWPIIIISLMS